MKKIYALAIAMFMLVVFKPLSAQTISITSAFDSTNSYCLPNSISNYFVSTLLSGYTPGDSVTYIVYFGDGSFETDKQPLFGTTTQQSFGYLQHTYTLPGTYTISIVAIAPDGKKDSIVSTTPIVISVCGNLEGKTYMDKNNDCLFNPGDDELAYMLVEVTSNSTAIKYYTVSDNNGDYEIKVPTGSSYSITLSHPFLSLACPSGGISSATVPSTSNNLGIQCSSGFDLFGKVTGMGFRPGRALTFYATPFNSTCTKTSGSISVVLSDSRISYAMGSSSPAPVISGDTLTWNFSNLDYTSLTNYFNVNSTRFKIFTDTSAKIGDSICIEVIVNPISGDINSTNNLTTYCFPIRNSFDPNEKSAQPLGFGAEEIINPGTTIDYTVHFQNTGNDVAYDVFILDTLDQNLDLTTISVTGASHSMDWNVFNGNMLRFDFKNINLPDSNANEPESHGFVSFSIKPKSATPLGTKIYNTAGIYFDFNDPIITNTVVRTVDIVNGISNKGSKESIIEIYPNPTAGMLTIDLKEADQSGLSIFSILGQNMDEIRLQKGRNTIDLTSYPTGVYLLRFNTGNRLEVKRVVVK